MRGRAPSHKSVLVPVPCYAYCSLSDSGLEFQLKRVETGECVARGYHLESNKISGEGVGCPHHAQWNGQDYPITCTKFQGRPRLAGHRAPWTVRPCSAQRCARQWAETCGHRLHRAGMSGSRPPVMLIGLLGTVRSLDNCHSNGIILTRSFCHTSKNSSDVLMRPRYPVSNPLEFALSTSFRIPRNRNGTLMTRHIRRLSMTSTRRP